MMAISLTIPCRCSSAFSPALFVSTLTASCSLLAPGPRRGVQTITLAKAPWPMSLEAV